MRDAPGIGIQVTKEWALVICLGMFAVHVLILTDLPTWLVGAGVSAPMAAIFGRKLRSLNEGPSQMEDVTHYFCDSAVTALATALAAYDREIYLHCRRVQALSLILARRCGIRDHQRLEALRIASLLHDLGKMAVSTSVLNKPCGLTAAEMEEVKNHASVGAEIVCKLPFEGPVVEWIKLHHERWDGTGYPFGLKGEQIPLEVRILALADCYDALRSVRAYRNLFSRDETVGLLTGPVGRAFDPSVLAVLLDDLNEVEEVREGLVPAARNSNVFAAGATAPRPRRVDEGDAGHR